MSATGTQTGAPAGAGAFLLWLCGELRSFSQAESAQSGISRRTRLTLIAADLSKKDASFNMDGSSKYAEWEQRGQGTVASNPHEGNEKPSGLDKAAGKLEEVTGKVMGDKELHARGLADQGKCTVARARSSRPPLNVTRRHLDG